MGNCEACNKEIESETPRKKFGVEFHKKCFRRIMHKMGREIKAGRADNANAVLQELNRGKKNGPRD